MAGYRTLALIPESAIMPGTSDPVQAPHSEIIQGINNAVKFAADMAYYSADMCQIDLHIRVVTESLPSSVFGLRDSQDYISPVAASDYLGLTGHYDCIMLLNPPALTTTTTFRGLGGTSSSTPFVWVKIGSQERDIAVHEFGHAMTVYLGTTTGEYTNFPVCGSEPAMHCATAYGFVDDLDPAWLSGFMQGTLSDGTGINATGWAVQTPTERGNKSQPPYQEFDSRWGRLPALPV